LDTPRCGAQHPKSSPRPEQTPEAVVVVVVCDEKLQNSRVEGGSGAGNSAVL